MRYDLTEKLKFNDDPVLAIGDTELTVHTDAETVLKLIDALQGGDDSQIVRMAPEMLLSEKDRKQLRSLHLKMDDYTTVVKTIVQLATGADPDSESGE